MLEVGDLGGDGFGGDGLGWVGGGRGSSLGARGGPLKGGRTFPFGCLIGPGDTGLRGLVWDWELLGLNWPGGSKPGLCWCAWEPLSGKKCCGGGPL